MPTYEFRCPEGHDFEKFYRTISGAESTATCPVCGQVAVRRMSAAGFAFKGSGFYLTDYGKNAHRGTAPESNTGATAEKAEKGDGADKAEKADKADKAEKLEKADKAEKAEKAASVSASSSGGESSAPAASKADPAPVAKPASTSKPSTSE